MKKRCVYLNAKCTQFPWILGFVFLSFGRKINYWNFKQEACEGNLCACLSLSPLLSLSLWPLFLSRPPPQTLSSSIPLPLYTFFVSLSFLEKLKTSDECFLFGLKGLCAQCSTLFFQMWTNLLPSCRGCCLHVFMDRFALPETAWGSGPAKATH